jgi:hypothetical protein
MATFLSTIPPSPRQTGAALGSAPANEASLALNDGRLQLRTLGLGRRERGCFWKFIDLKYEHTLARPVSVKSKFLLPERRIEVHGGLVRPSTEFRFSNRRPSRLVRAPS